LTRQSRTGIQAGQKGVDFVIPTLGLLQFKAQEGGLDRRISFFRLFVRKAGTDESKLVHRAGSADTQGWQSLPMPTGRYDLLLVLHHSGYSPVWVRGVHIEASKTPTTVLFPVTAGAELQVTLAPSQDPLPKAGICAVLTPAEASKVKRLTRSGVPVWEGTRDLPSDAIWHRTLRLAPGGSSIVRGLPAGEYVIQPFGAAILVEPSSISLRPNERRKVQLRWRFQ